MTVTHRANLELKPGDWVYNHGFAHASMRRPGVVFEVRTYEGGVRGQRSGYDWVGFVIPGYGTSLGARRNFTIIPAELVDKVEVMTDEDIWHYIDLCNKYSKIMSRINKANSELESGSGMHPIPQAWFDEARSVRRELNLLLEGAVKEGKDA